jgi:hypothetical protein
MSRAHTVEPLPAASRLTRLGLAASVSLLCACPVRPEGSEGGNGSTTLPPASVYEIDPEFAGEWTGDVDGHVGTLMIGEIEERVFYGSFVTDDGRAEYTLLLEQTYVFTQEGGEVPSNRVLFTWQDGLGSRGKGWLLVNQQDTALTGSFGYGVATEGLGEWSFERVDL